MRHLLWCVLLFVSCGAGDPLVDVSEGLPNVVLIGLDTFRADHIGALGSDLARTPQLDRFAAESIVFTDCASTSTWTLPAFASVFTGRLPAEHRTIGGEWIRLPMDEIPLAERLKANGYHTTAFVAVDYLGKEFGMDRGFDRHLNHSQFPVNGRLEHYDRRLRNVLRVPPREPWFLFAHYFDAHDPYEAPAPFGRMYYEGDEKVEPGDPARSIDVIYSERNRIRQNPQRRYAWLEGVRDLEFPVREYAAGVSYVDHHVGVTLDSMRSTGVLDESIVIILADHGEHLTEHDTFFTHRWPYAETLQVPLMIRLPRGVGAGMRIDAPVSLVDVLPTLLDLLGLESAPGLTGQSLTGLMRGEGAEPRLLFAEYGAKSEWNARSVWDADWRYTEFVDGGVLTASLFDRRADPREEHDLAPEHPELVELYAAALQARFGSDRPSILVPGAVAPEVELDPETRARLQALGYVDVGGE